MNIDCHSYFGDHWDAPELYVDEDYPSGHQDLKCNDLSLMMWFTIVHSGD